MAALAVAIVKPWESSGTARPSPRSAAIAAPSLASIAPSTPTPGGRVRPAGPLLTPGLSAPGWAEIASVVGGHATSGVIAVAGQTSRFTTESGAAVRYSSVWHEGGPESGDRPPAGLQPGDLTTFALGLTYARGDAPDDVRFWLAHADGSFQWIDSANINRPRPDDPALFVRHGSSSITIEPWQPGTYRVDVLRRGRVERMTVMLADASGVVPALAETPLATEARLVAASDSDPSAVRVGLFATVDGLGVSLDVTTSRPLDEAGAWTAANDPPAGGQAPVVAKVFLPRATGLGVMLTSHASVELAVMRRLSPTPLAPTPPARGGISESQGRTPYVVFAAPDGHALSPGVYAISVSWSDDAGVHAATWHVELRPGPIPTAG